MKRLMIGVLVAMAVLIGRPVGAQAQTAPTSTTLSAAIVAGQNIFNLASGTGVTVGYELMVDKEAMLVNGVSGTQVSVQRGYNTTVGAPHASGATVYVGPTGSTTGGPFWSSDPLIGSCTAANEQYTLRLVPSTGRVWSCANGQWTSVVDAYVFIPATACNSSVSGNGTGTNGFTTLGTAPSIPVVQASTSASGTNTHYYSCNLSVPSRTNAVKASYVVDVTFFYGVQTTGLGTQVAVLASGTMNAANVFSTIDYPTAAASETAKGLADAARGDAGTLVITPVVGSFNVATTTAGQFYSAKFTPANPIAMATDNRQLFFTASLLNTATSATVTNSPGVLVHYRFLNVGI